MKRQVISPVKDASVLNPETGLPLPKPTKKKPGTRVWFDSYWERRLTDGVIELVSGSLKDALDKKAEKIKEMKAAADKKVVVDKNKGNKE